MHFLFIVYAETLLSCQWSLNFLSKVVGLYRVSFFLFKKSEKSFTDSGKFVRILSLLTTYPETTDLV